MSKIEHARNAHTDNDGTWLPVATAASYAGISPQTIYNRIKSKAIRHKDRDGRTLVLMSEINGMKNARTFNSSGAPTTLSQEVDSAIDRVNWKIDPITNGAATPQPDIDVPVIDRRTGEAVPMPQDIADLANATIEHVDSLAPRQDSLALARSKLVQERVRVNGERETLLAARERIDGEIELLDVRSLELDETERAIALIDRITKGETS